MIMLYVELWLLQWLHKEAGTHTHNKEKTCRKICCLEIKNSSDLICKCHRHMKALVIPAFRCRLLFRSHTHAHRPVLLEKENGLFLFLRDEPSILRVNTTPDASLIFAHACNQTLKQAHMTKNECKEPHHCLLHTFVQTKMTP